MLTAPSSVRELPNCRSGSGVLFLRYYADLDYEAIADALEIRPGTVGATLNAAHKRLAQELQEVQEWEM